MYILKTWELGILTRQICWVYIISNSRSGAIQRNLPETLSQRRDRQLYQKGCRLHREHPTEWWIMVSALNETKYYSTCLIIMFDTDVLFNHHWLFGSHFELSHPFRACTMLQKLGLRTPSYESVLVQEPGANT